MLSGLIDNQLIETMGEGGGVGVEKQASKHCHAYYTQPKKESGHLFYFNYIDSHNYTCSSNERVILHHDDEKKLWSLCTKHFTYSFLF